MFYIKKNDADNGIRERNEKGLDVTVAHERIDSSDKGCHQKKRKKAP